MLGFFKQSVSSWHFAKPGEAFWYNEFNFFLNHIHVPALALDIFK